MKMSKKRQSIYDKSGGFCWYCGCELVKGWHADHFEPVFRVLQKSHLSHRNSFGEIPERIKELIKNNGMENPEKDHPDNMVPSCAPCNLFKSTYSVEGFRREIEEQTERAMKQSVNYRTALRFGQVAETKKPVVFWFEENNLGL